MRPAPSVRRTLDPTQPFQLLNVPSDGRLTEAEAEALLVVLARRLDLGRS
jgi:hypothetical protein